MALKILIAEDSPVDSLVLRNVLTRDGYEPVLVENGKAALQALEADPDIALAIVAVPGRNQPGRALERAQIELVAGRVSALNECFY